MFTNKSISDFQWVLLKLVSEAATNVVLQKKVFLEMSQNLQENTGVGVSFW